jgi:GTP-binding protein HflX
MKTISGADVLIKDQLFATLDTTIRTVKLDNSHRILLSDTVGFVRKLPHHLVASFKSTLKEVVEADLILIMLDASSNEVNDHYNTIIEVLKDLGVERCSSLIILNKIDNKNVKKQMAYLKRTFPEAIFISALNKLMIDSLNKKIIDIMDMNFQVVDLHFTYQESKKLALAQEGVDVLERIYNDDHVYLKVKGSRKRISQIQSNLIE